MDKAETLYRDLQRKYPANHAVAYALAQLQMSREDYPNALTAIRNARKGQPENVWYAILEADILEKTGRYKDAAALYRELVTANPKESYYYQQWAFYLIKAGDATGAIQVFDQHEQELGFQEEIAQKNICSIGAWEKCRKLPLYSRR
ncbi:MAG: tetratricopeptide repeat protein [Saprospiraceae bacterium]|nr:tetratricopeptide repeat protein [Saprospiraceae bacterium]